MEPEGSLPHSQQKATCTYVEPDLSSPCPHPTSRKSILILLDSEFRFLCEETEENIGTPQPGHAAPYTAF